MFATEAVGGPGLGRVWMTADWIGAMASLIGAVAAGVGLFAIWRTLRHAQEQNENSIYQLVTNRMASITEKFLEHPEIRPYFYEDSRLDEEHPSFAVVNAKIKVMCEMLFDHAEVVLARPNVMGALGESYQAYFCDLVSHSPALQEYWRTRRNWYVAPLQQIFDEVVITGVPGGAQPVPGRQRIDRLPVK
jgi:hypothetical protein